MIHAALRAAAHTLYTRSLSHSLIFNSLSQREAVSGKLLGNALRKLHPNPESAGSRTLLGAVQRAARPRPGWGPVSGHPQGGEERQGPDFRPGEGVAPSPGTLVVASTFRLRKKSRGPRPWGRHVLANSMSMGAGSQVSFPRISPHALNELTSRPPTPGRPRRADTSPLPGLRPKQAPGPQGLGQHRGARTSRPARPPPAPPEVPLSPARSPSL